MEENTAFNTCRLCLSGSGGLINIFDSSDIEYTLSDVITELLRHEVSAGDNYPQCICSDCTRKLREFKRFKDKCDSCKELLDKARAAKVISSVPVIKYESPNCDEVPHVSGNLSLNESVCLVDEDPLAESLVVPEEVHDTKPFVEIANDTEDDVPTVFLKVKQEDMNMSEAVMIDDGESMADMDVSSDSTQGAEGSTNVAGGSSVDEQGLNKRKHKCPECGKEFVSAKTYCLHMHSHKYGVNLQCDNCGEMFTNMVNFTFHKSMDCVKKIKCDQCTLYFKHEASLKKHMVRHGPKEFHCEHCDYSFFTKQDLTNHRKTHNREKNHPCDVCGERFDNKIRLRIHMYEHEGKNMRKGKMQTCSECGYKASSVTLIMNHMRKHSGEKPFSCSECGMKFTTKSSMVGHIRLHRFGSI